MARTPDKPGSYRVRQKASGGWFLSGVKSDGRRVKMPVDNEWEGERLAQTLGFGKPAATPAPTIPVITAPPTFDEWGIPVVTEAQSADIAGAMGVPPPVSETQKKVEEVNQARAEDAKKAAEVQAQRKKYAKSMCEMIGHAYAGGVVMGSHRLVTSAGKVPVKPSPKQVSDLAEVTADTIKEWFGDHEVKPWIMMVMLSIGIPLAMYIQSPKAPRKELPAQSAETEQSPGLKSVS